jgi:hypothetical protein
MNIAAASFMDLLASQANVSDIRSDILIGNITFASPMFLYLAPLLRSIVFICQPALSTMTRESNCILRHARGYQVDSTPACAGRIRYGHLSHEVAPMLDKTSILRPHARAPAAALKYLRSCGAKAISICADVDGAEIKVGYDQNAALIF